MPYTQISPAVDWAYIQLPVAPMNTLTAFHVAVWALNDKGEVVGLVSLPGGGPEDENMGQICRLLCPPPLRGVYKHISELNANEIRSLQANQAVSVEH